MCFGKMIMSTNHKEEKIQQILSIKMRSFLKWKFRVMNSIVIFDPGGNQSINLRSNSLKEWEYDDNLIFSLLTIIIVIVG